MGRGARRVSSAGPGEPCLLRAAQLRECRAWLVPVRGAPAAGLLFIGLIACAAGVSLGLGAACWQHDEGGQRDRKGLADPYITLQGLAAEGLGLGACFCAPVLRYRPACRHWAWACPWGLEVAGVQGC